jgi:energy-converting hydrogenase Eha subunit F
VIILLVRTTISFIRVKKTGTTWEEQQKMDALRKVYHRAVQIPLENVEVLWKDYEAFENGLNKITVWNTPLGCDQPSPATKISSVCRKSVDYELPSSRFTNLLS